MKKPKAVLISDIHFTPATLELASQSLIAAKECAIELDVPLIIAGDTLDSKAIIRGECANRLIEILNDRQFTNPTLMLVGNHDLLNEKSKEHSLNFLRPYCQVIDRPADYPGIGRLIPYFSNPETLKTYLGAIQKGDLLIMHQGVQTADMGHYVQDKTSLPKETFEDFRVISGHYHCAQDIKCGRPRKGAVGLFSYIGNPYTLSFGEANDGPKGYQILNDDGSLTQIPLDLRTHIILKMSVDEMCNYDSFYPSRADDLIWLKLTGTREQLSKVDKKDIGRLVVGHMRAGLDIGEGQFPQTLNAGGQPE